MQIIISFVAERQQRKYFMWAVNMLVRFSQFPTCLILGGDSGTRDILPHLFLTNSFINEIFFFCCLDIWMEETDTTGEMINF